MKLIRSLAVPVLAFLFGMSCMGWIVNNLVLNLSPSIAKGVYRLEVGEVAEGVVVRTCAGDHGEVFGARGYLMPGFCPGGLGMVLKRVAATSGDTVSSGALGMTINGIPVAHPSPTEDGEGLPVPRWEVEGYLLGPNEIVVLGDHPQSLDSRVFGPLDAEQVECCLHPLF